FGKAAHLYALRVLRVGCMLSHLRAQVREAGSHNFEAIASQALPNVEPRTRRRYIKAYEKYCTYEMEISAGDRPALMDDSAIDVEAVEDEEISDDQQWSDPRSAPMTDVLSAPDFETYLGNGRVRKSLFSRVRRVLGDRGITKLY